MSKEDRRQGLPGPHGSGSDQSPQHPAVTDRGADIVAVSEEDILLGSFVEKVFADIQEHGFISDFTDAARHPWHRFRVSLKTLPGVNYSVFMDLQEYRLQHGLGLSVYPDMSDPMYTDYPWFEYHKGRAKLDAELEIDGKKIKGGSSNYIRYWAGDFNEDDVAEEGRIKLLRDLNESEVDVERTEFEFEKEKERSAQPRWVRDVVAFDADQISSPDSEHPGSNS